MSYQVRVVDVAARPTVVIATTTTWDQFPTVWKGLLGEVWACVRAGGIRSGCRNVMLYLDDTPRIEVGVQLSQPGPLTGRVVASMLPAGRAAMTVHRGSYAELHQAHQAVLDWCTASGEHLTRTRWEVYGPHRDDITRIWTEVYWLLA
jgi:effector-binding domain-containing protein